MLGKFDEAEDREISLIDIFLFLKNSLNNISKSVVISLLAGFGHYFYTPSIYEATVNLQMAQVAGSSVESPTVLLEKIKLPLFFTKATLKSCDSTEETLLSKRMADRIKPTLNKSAPFIAFSVQTKSTKQAKECLHAVIADIRAKQAEIAKPILEQKKAQLQQLSERLKLVEETSKLLSPIKITESFSDVQFASRALSLSMSQSSAKEVNDLRNTINDIEVSLLEPQTRSTYLTAPIYAPEVAINKRPLLTLCICLMIGIFLGLALTSVQGNLPILEKQIKFFN